MAPRFMYGTAWKELETERLTRLALEAGFRAIDTANQRKHYHEAGVGAALQAAYRDGVVRREELFLQTKFTDVGGQDQRLPYDPRADLEVQVEQSFASSLQHLGTTWLDSYVLHGPTEAHGLADDDWRIWGAMEALHRGGKARALGVSNVDREQLAELHGSSRVKPSFVQNRCYARHGWDADVRAFCREHAIAYQGFSLLTANPHVVSHPDLRRAAAARDKTPAQLVFAYCVQHLGILPLTGTSDPRHMREDLAALDLTLDEKEIALVTTISSRRS